MLLNQCSLGAHCSLHVCLIDLENLFTREVWASETTVGDYSARMRSEGYVLDLSVSVRL